MEAAERMPAVERLIVAAAARCELFTDGRTARPYAIVTAPTGVRRTVALDEGSARRWLSQVARQEGVTPTSETIGAALVCLQADALADAAPRHDLDLRFARDGADLLLDAGDPGWTMIRVGASGWRVEPHGCPPRFWRSGTMRPLATPDPTAGAANLSAELRRLLGLDSDTADLLASWLPAALVADAPRYGLLLTGPEGSGKSTVARVLAGVLDPKEPPFRRLDARDPKDLMVAAEKAAIFAVDNLSHLSHGSSDDLCGLITGTGAAFRGLYSNRDEEAFSFRRALLLTGVTVTGIRPDLADRLLHVEVPLRVSGFRSERELVATAAAAQPRLLGAVFDAAAGMLRELPRVEAAHAGVLGTLRMRDAAAHMAAAGEAMGIGASRVLDLLTVLRRGAKLATVEADPVADAIYGWAVNLTAPWTGTVTALETAVRPADPPKTWIGSPQWWAPALRRCVATLDGLGVRVELGKHGRAGTPVAVHPPPSVDGSTSRTSPRHDHFTHGPLSRDEPVTSDRAPPPDHVTRRDGTEHVTDHVTEHVTHNPSESQAGDERDERDVVPATKRVPVEGAEVWE